MNTPNEPPKSFWKRPLKGLRGVGVWWLTVGVAAFVFAVAMTLLIGWRAPWNRFVESVVSGMVIFVVMVTVASTLCIVGCWLCRWRNLRRTLFGLACLATLIALLYAEEDLRGKWAWNRYKDELESKGVKLEVAKLAPPPVPDDQNFAMAPIVASSYSGTIDRNGRPIRPSNTNVVNRMRMPIEVEEWPRGADHLEAPPLGNWQAGKPTDLQAWQKYYQEAGRLTNVFPVPPRPQSPAADVLLALSKYNSAIEDLRQAAKRPDSRFPLEYDAEEPAIILLPHLAPLKGCANTLRLRACAELADNEPDQALEDVMLQLRLANALRSEPFLISQLVRIAIVQVSMQPVWEGLVDHRWSDGQLAKLYQQLKILDVLSGYRLGIDGERACATGNIDYFRRTRKTEGIASFGPGTLIPSGWFYQNELRIVRFETDWYLPLTDLEHRTVSSTAVSRAETALGEELRHKDPYNYAETIFLPALAKAVQKFAFTQVSVDLARVACALERYRLAHGQYPESLDALTPAFLDRVPHDVIGGQPLKYRSTDGGQFVLYSVGWNETDDGGRVVMNEGSNPTVDISEGDWVWPSQAK